MKPAEFHLHSVWRVRGTVELVYEILSRPEDFVRWWSSVYLEVRELVPGDADGIGRVVGLRTRGRLPYELAWQAHAVERERPHRLVVRAEGDLQGHGEWRLQQVGEYVEAAYRWTVLLNRPWMRRLAPVLKPVYEANHRWAMRQGREGLQLELDRRMGDGERCP